jgi:glycine/D-amino acid oxidase-like deaminating enzyme/nitrite reductase/ring-hydroxylating ferredoxin subunit
MSVTNPSPLWAAEAPSRLYPPLHDHLDVDVAVIGGGITGLTLAYQIKRAGRRVAVFEMRSVGLGATGHTSGHLTAALDTDYATLARRFGDRAANEAWRKSMAAIAYIEEVSAREHIACDFRRVDGWRYTEDEGSSRPLERELSAARRLGIAVDWRFLGPLPFMRGALCFHHQARFQPVAYVSGLAQRVHGEGCHVFERTRVDAMQDGDPCVLQVGGYRVTARDVVHATHTPMGVQLPVQWRIAPYMSYVLVVRVDGAVPSDLYWDTAHPYHYVRPVTLPDGVEALLIGGEDHKAGQDRQTAARFGALERYARDRFAVRGVEGRWSWEVFESADGLPYVGRLGRLRHVYGITGLSGNGLTWGTAGAVDVAEQILVPLGTSRSVLRPQRTPSAVSVATYLKENANVAWRMLRDRVPRPAGRVAETVLAPGEGRVVDGDRIKKAVYRSSSGELHVLSAVCPHAGGIVRWNEAAGTWDCPLHGSRFGPTGELLAGPATRDLAPHLEAVDDVGQERSISHLIAELRVQGYRDELVITSAGRIRCPTRNLEVDATECRIDAFHRFEGVSDPADMCVVVAMRLPGSGAECLGVLVLAFGPTASPEEKMAWASLPLPPAERAPPPT